MAVQCAEQGYAKTAVSDIVQGARVSRKSFYEQFDNKQDCALEAFDQLSRELVEVVERACKTRAAWRDRVCAGIWAALEHLSVEPSVAHFLTIDAVAIGPRGIAAQHATFERLARGLAPGRTANPRADWMSPESEWGLVAYMSMLIARRITNDGAGRLLDLAPELIEATLTPYLGLEQARETAGRLDPQGLPG